jgi:hypothetical protein
MDEQRESSPARSWLSHPRESGHLGTARRHARKGRAAAAPRTRKQSAALPWMREPAPSLEGLLSFVPGRRRRHPGGDARSSDEAALLIRHGVVIRRCSRTSMLGQASTFLSFQPNRVAPTGHEHEALQRASFEAARCDRPRRRHARTAAAALSSRFARTTSAVATYKCDGDALRAGPLQPELGGRFGACFARQSM